MYELLTEQYSLEGNILSRQLAVHITVRGPQGKVAIVTNMPVALLSSTRKQWLRLIRLMERERSGILNPIRKEQIEMDLVWMRQLKLSAKAPHDELEADVTFATVEDFVHTPPDCRIVYVTYDFERAKLHMLTSWMPRNGLVVFYDQE